MRAKTAVDLKAMFPKATLGQIAHAMRLSVFPIHLYLKSAGIEFPIRGRPPKKRLP